VSKLRFGICGLGFAGSVLMAPSLRSHPHTEIVAACDPHEDTRLRFAAKYGVKTYSAIEKMLDAEDLDAIYVASPHQWHREHVALACRHQVHVLVEKPLAVSIEDADEIVELVRAAGIQLVVGASRSHDPVVRTMANIVRSGQVGKVAMVTCLNYTDFLYRPRRPEELDTRLGGGIIFNQLPHQIDCVKAITSQRIEAVRAITGGLDPQRPTEGHCAALLTLDGGACATLVYSGYDHFDSDELQFWISEGGQAKAPRHGKARRDLRDLKGKTEADLRRDRYSVEGPVATAMSSSAYQARRQPHFGLIVASCERADLRPSPDGIYIYDQDGVREIPAMTGSGSFGQGDAIDELCDAISGRSPVLRDAEWGRDTLKVCLAILESSRTGAQVAV
jgi:phthalate 4,5-cis-dihydrodiol dehydrogenase